jgi:hypothetical protein
LDTFQRRDYDCQQGDGEIMFWFGIINNEIRVKNGVKITAKKYTAFLKEILLPWYKKKSLSFRKKIIFMHDNAPSCTCCARLTLGFLKKSLVKKCHKYGLASVFP